MHQNIINAYVECPCMPSNISWHSWGRIQLLFLLLYYLGGRGSITSFTYLLQGSGLCLYCPWELFIKALCIGKKINHISSTILYELNLLLICYQKCSTYFHQPHRQLGNSPGVHWLSIQTTSCHYLCAARGSHHHGVTSAHQSDWHYSHTGSQPEKQFTGA